MINNKDVIGFYMNMSLILEVQILSFKILTTHNGKKMMTKKINNFSTVGLHFFNSSRITKPKL